MRTFRETHEFGLHLAEQWTLKIDLNYYFCI